MIELETPLPSLFTKAGVTILHGLLHSMVIFYGLSQPMTLRLKQAYTLAAAGMRTGDHYCHFGIAVEFSTALQ